MSNNYLSLASEKASEKFFLCRLNPCRDISHSLEVDSGTRYKMTFPFRSVNKVVVNGTEYTLNNSTTLSTGEYSFDQTTKLLKIELGQSVSVFQSDGAIAVFYYLFYTSRDFGFYDYEDPYNKTGNIYYWHSKLIGNARLTESIENITMGILSFSSLDIELKNHDKDFQKYLSVYDSFSKKDVKIWHTINNTNNIIPHYIGTTISISLSSTSVSISTDNILSKLNNMYSPYGYLISTKYSNLNDLDTGGVIFKINEDDQNKDIIQSFTQVTPTVCNPNPFSSYVFRNSVNNCDFYDTGLKAINISYDKTIASDTNLKWCTGIRNFNSSSGVVGQSSDYSFYIAEVTTSDLGSSGRLTYQKIKVTDTTLFNAGDNILVTDYLEGGFSSTQAGLIVKVDSIDGYIYAETTTDLSIGNLVYRPAISLVQLKLGSESSPYQYHSLVYGTDYNIGYYGFTKNGVTGYIQYISITSDIHTTYDYPTKFGDEYTNGLPNDLEVIYRKYNDLDLNHAVVIKDLLTNCGIPVNEDSFTNASETEINTSFTLPYYDQTEYPTFQDVIQKILSNTFGYLQLNNNFEIEYKLIESPSADYTINDEHIIDDTITQQIDYKDIITRLEFNYNYGSFLYQDPVFHLETSDTRFESSVSSYKAKYLHDIDQTKSIEKVVDDLSARKDLIASFLFNRKFTISFDLKILQNLNIGDGVSFTSIKSIINKNYMTINTQKSDNIINVTLLDLYFGE